VECVPALKMKTHTIHISSIDWIIDVVSPVTVGAAGSPDPIRSVGNNGHVWPPLPLMSLQSKIFDIVGEL